VLFGLPDEHNMAAKYPVCPAIITHVHGPKSTLVNLRLFLDGEPRWMQEMDIQEYYEDIPVSNIVPHPLKGTWSWPPRV